VPKQSSDLPWQRAIILLNGTVLAIVVVASLYLVQVIFIPLALAVLLAFLLGPLVRLLQKHGIPRAPSVVLVILLAAAFLGGLGWLIGSQLTELVEELPNYEANIKKKIEFVKGISPGDGRLQHMVESITEQWQEKSPKPDINAATQPPVEQPQKPTIVMSPLGSSWVDRLPHYLGTAMASVGGLIFVLALSVFMLLNREDLRGRFLRLAGRDHLTLTTKAVDEAFHRISRFLLMQLLLNSTLGVLLAVGLALMGLHHAILWGITLAIMRYIPYIGAWIVGALLLALSIATSADWLHPIMVFGLFAVLEVLASNVAEPLLYGKSIGVSQVALLVAAAFWAFLWGPIGLVLSGPMTVCLVVLGKYVPQLKFIDVLLGDEPALSPDVSYYQRLLAQDKEEAIDLVLTQAKTWPAERVYDSLLIPALSYAKRDRDREELSEQDELFIQGVTREILENLHDQPAPETIAAPNEAATKIRILACPGQDEADSLALEMLQHLLDRSRWQVELASSELLISEIVALVHEERPALVCIGSLPPGGFLQARHLCKRLSAEAPDTQIVVGRWGLRDNIEKIRDDLKEAGANDVWTSLAEATDKLKTLFSELRLKNKLNEKLSATPVTA
jgi:predicted PurR-regulated permease PerM